MDCDFLGGFDLGVLVRVGGGTEDFVVGRVVAGREGEAAAEGFGGAMGFGSAAGTARAGADRGAAATGRVGCSGGSTDRYSPQRGQCRVIVVAASRTLSFDRQPGHSTI